MRQLRLLAPPTVEQGRAKLGEHEERSEWTTLKVFSWNPVSVGRLVPYYKQIQRAQPRTLGQSMPSGRARSQKMKRSLS
jgi:hypothetical protein